MRAAQARGVPVLAETCAQYLVLDDSVFERRGRPPLRLLSRSSRSRRTSSGCGRGSAAARCRWSRPTPAPSRREQKAMWNGDWTKIPMGLPGPRDAAPAGLHPRRARRPAHARGAVHEAQHQPGADHGPLPRGRARSWSAPTPTWRSSIPTATRTVSTRRRWRPTPTGRPFEGWELAGFARTTLSRGEVIVDEYAVVGREGRGQWLPRTTAGSASPRSRRRRPRRRRSTLASARPPRVTRRRSPAQPAVERRTSAAARSGIRTSPRRRPSAAPGPPTTSPRSGSG